MPTIAEFSRRVEEMEKGDPPVRFEDWAGIISHLIDTICAESWRDGEERSAAQILVYRLEKLKRERGGVAAPIEIPAPAPPRKQARKVEDEPSRAPAQRPVPAAAAVSSRTRRPATRCHP
jgi:hypothetical protein